MIFNLAAAEDQIFWVKVVLLSIYSRYWQYWCANASKIKWKQSTFWKNLDFSLTRILSLWVCLCSCSASAHVREKQNPKLPTGDKSECWGWVEEALDGSVASELCGQQAWKQFNYGLVFALQENHQKAQCWHNMLHQCSLHAAFSYFILKLNS